MFNSHTKYYKMSLNHWRVISKRSYGKTFWAHPVDRHNFISSTTADISTIHAAAVCWVRDLWPAYIIRQLAPFSVHVAEMTTMSCLILMDTKTLFVFLIAPVITQLLQHQHITQSYQHSLRSTVNEWHKMLIIYYSAQLSGLSRDGYYVRCLHF